VTTLQLAERIAKRVIRAHLGYTEDPEPAARLAVLQALCEQNSWFCRIKTDANGDDIGDEPYEMIQQELFSK
jgi:hypothetical protein